MLDHGCGLPAKRSGMKAVGLSHSLRWRWMIHGLIQICVFGAIFTPATSSAAIASRGRLGRRGGSYARREGRSRIG